MYSFTSRVRYSELAEDKKASLVSIINYFQDCCTFESEDGDIGLSWLAKHGTSWMLTGWQIHIIRRPRYCEHIKITTWACGFKYFVGKRSFTISTMDGQVLVYAMSDWAYVNIKKGLPEKHVPEKELEVYGLDTPIEERFEEFGLTDYVKENGEMSAFKGKMTYPGFDQMQKEAPITITADNLDTNHHVNNGQYVALAKSVIPEEIYVKHFRAEIKKQSVLGDLIIPYIYRENNKIIVILTDENGAIKIITEFITE
ncbi:MAG: acyl-[acyl-carrier-protein] thioesterase [Eubacterium sp.]|nr:acyl-[acyl-carrier-protein] thioesterase [Eubacterium sp.]